MYVATSCITHNSLTFVRVRESLLCCIYVYMFISSRLMVSKYSFVTRNSFRVSIIAFQKKTCTCMHTIDRYAWLSEWHVAPTYDTIIRTIMHLCEMPRQHRDPPVAPLLWRSACCRRASISHFLTILEFRVSEVCRCFRGVTSSLDRKDHIGFCAGATSFAKLLQHAVQGLKRSFISARGRLAYVATKVYTLRRISSLDGSVKTNLRTYIRKDMSHVHNII